MNNMSPGFFLAGLASITVAGCAFLLGPEQVRSFLRQYNFPSYKKSLFLSRYLLGSWPLFQSIVIFFLPSSNEKSFILLATGIVIFLQYLILIKDRLYMEKKNYLEYLNREDIRNINKKVIKAAIPSFYGTIISFAISIRLDTLWTTQQMNVLLTWLLPVCVALYFISAGIGAVFVLWIKRHPGRLEDRSNL